MRGWRAEVYQYCGDKAHSAPRIAAALADLGGHDASAEDIGRFLATCVSRRLMVGEKGRYLSIALPAPERGRSGH
jgi:hypothetical protein